jgi:threonine dehydrogenase-like Zn-dependent dehydrogenase
MANTMQAARYYGRHDVRIETVQAPTPGPGQALVAVAACGVCGSDAAEYAQGPLFTQPLESRHPVTGDSLPVVLGHEFAGTIVDVGQGVDRSRIGQLVCCGGGVSCGRCVRCVDGRTNLCSQYYTLGLHADGGLAEYMVAPADILLDAGSFGLTADAAALGQPMAIAVHSVSRGNVLPGQTALVVGLGGIGAFITHAAAASQAEVIALDIAPERLGLARSLGAKVTSAVSPEVGVEGTVRELGRNVDVIFEATGRPEVLRDCLSLLRPGGRLVIVGVQKGASDLSLRAVATLEQDVVGTSAHVFGRDLPRALELLAARSAGWADIADTARPLTELVSHGLEPLSNGKATITKTLYDPRIAAPRPATYSLRQPSGAAGD